MPRMQREFFLHLPFSTYNLCTEILLEYQNPQELQVKHDWILMPRAKEMVFHYTYPMRQKNLSEE